MNIEIQSKFNHLSIIYTLFSISFLINWIRFKYRHPSLYPEDKFISFIIILMISVFWLFAVPFYWIEHFRKNKM